MDPIKGEKLRAMKSYKKQNNSQIFYSLIVHLLIAIACCLLCSYSHWFPSLYTAKHLLFMSLPNSWSGFFNPRCLFIVVNFIVVFLIGESRLSGRQSSPANEMYNEYVERTRSLRASTFQEKKEERTVPAILSQKEDNAKILEEKEVDEIKEDKHEDDQDEDFKECEGTDEEEKEEENEKKEEGKKVEKKEEEIEQEKEEEEEEEEEAAGIPAEELNKRVEAFIARVNKQRSLEARFLVCSKA